MKTIVNINGCWGDLANAEILEITDEAHEELCEGAEIEHIADEHVLRSTNVEDLYYNDEANGGHE